MELLASTCLEQLIISNEHNQGSQEPQQLSWSLSIPLMAVFINERPCEPYLPSTEVSAS